MPIMAWMRGGQAIALLMSGLRAAAGFSKFPFHWLWWTRAGPIQHAAITIENVQSLEHFVCKLKIINLITFLITSFGRISLIFNRFGLIIFL